MEDIELQRKKKQAMFDEWKSDLNDHHSKESNDKILLQEKNFKRFRGNKKSSGQEEIEDLKMMTKRAIKSMTVVLLCILPMFTSGCGSVSLNTDPNEIASVMVTPNNSVIPIGGTQNFVATETNFDGKSTVNTNSVAWVSSNPTVAIVMLNGSVKGISNGVVTIRATSGLKSGASTLTVNSNQSPEIVPLGSAKNFVILSKLGISNNVELTLTIIGSIGTSPVSSSAMNTITCANVVGTIYGVDSTYSGGTCFGFNTINKLLVDKAILDMENAYGNAVNRISPNAVSLGDGNISGMTIKPGLYKWNSGLMISDEGLTFSGGPNDVWIFQIAENLIVGNNSIINLIGGAQAKNIFWQVGGQAAIGKAVEFKGILLCRSLITVDSTTVVKGCLYAQTEVKLQGNSVTNPN
jgi:hypothetical protein